MKRFKYFNILCLVFLLSISGFVIYKLIQRESQYTHIEKTIKKHNAIKESLENPTHPTISKPASSQIGVIGMDSVRVIQ
tara:strand:+ start:148 stop:384 length:237 start_codon:yes stop_codon:yes gene_type:complete